MSRAVSETSNLPDFLKTDAPSPTAETVYFLDLRGNSQGIMREGRGGKLDRAIGEALDEILPRDLPRPALIKTHIGDPGNTTRIDPELANSTIEILRGRGVDRISCGDATVAYTSERGFRRNPPGDPSRYLDLARAHGWSRESTGVSFIVLDRPETSVSGMLEFEEREVIIEADFSENLGAVHSSGGLHAAGTVINHVHLTLHPQTHLALAVKGLAMGAASSNGKFQLHQNLWPDFLLDKCTLCGSCADLCPQGAIEMDLDGGPALDRKACVGCGQCLIACRDQGDCIVMEGDRIRDWSRGTDILGRRLIDYLVGMFKGKWEFLVNICHLVNITKDCDCLEGRQTPFVEDIGFLVGRNPVAMDYLAMKLLLDQCSRTLISRYRSLEILSRDGPGRDMFHYARERYGFSLRPGLEIIKV